jgi:hypothetical protein
MAHLHSLSGKAERWGRHRIARTSNHTEHQGGIRHEKEEVEDERKNEKRKCVVRGGTHPEFI